MKFIDLIGNKYGKLEVIKRVENNNSNKICYLCKCDCGKLKIIQGASLKNGRTKSCGCIRNEFVVKKNTKHNLSNSRLYIVWKNMKERCLNKNCHKYKDYSARGITICKEWKNNFESFYNWAYKNGYDENAKYGKCTIDRINNDGNYEPSNCRFVDMKIQCNNRRIKSRK